MTAAESLQAFVSRYLADCFAKGTPPQVNELASNHGVRAIVLSRAFHAAMGVHLSHYLKHACIERAKELLLSSTLPVADIARAAAFGTKTTFFRAFKRATGMTPTEFRQRGKKT